MEKRLINLREIIIVGAIALALLIIGTFLDFRIAEALYPSGSNGNVFNSLCASVGPFISCFIGSFAGACLVFLPQDKIWKRILIALGGAGIFAGSVWGNIGNVKDMVNDQPIGGDALKWSLIVFFALAGVAAVVLAILAVKKLDKKVLFKVCFIIFWIFVSYYLLNEALKFLASRPRPWTLFIQYSKDPILGFKNWYEFTPFRAFKEHPGRFYKSFPSGHAQNSGIMLITVPVLTYLCPKLNNRKAQVILFYASFAYTLMIMFSRVWAGAHFVSDVSFGLLLDVAIIFIVQEIFLKYYPKEVKEEKDE